DGRVNAVHHGHPLQRTSCRPGRSGAEGRGDGGAHAGAVHSHGEGGGPQGHRARTPARPRQVHQAANEAVEERSRVEKDEPRREMTEQQQRMQKELESAAGREERMRRQLMEAQEGIAHGDAFLQQLQEEAELSASALKQAARMGWGGVGWGGVGWDWLWWCG
ncbi:unnamed protein product, partial [Closterium sp. NIES-53]